jgi:hypothetical protein
VSQALQAAVTEMTPNMGTFSSTFAPQLLDNNLLIENLVNSLVLVVGVGAAFTWNVGTYMTFPFHK